MTQKNIKDLAWNTFKQTGNIDTFMEFIKLENIQGNNKENIEGIQYGNYQNKGDHSFRK